MKYCLAAFLLLSLGGCELVGSDDTLPIRLEADADAYQPGQEVELTLFNNSGRTFMVSGTLCHALLQQRDGPFRWTPIYRDGACLDVGFELRSGNRVVASRQLPDSLAAGDYRFMYTLNEAKVEDRYSHIERIEVFTEIFKVENKQQGNGRLRGSTS